MEKGADIVALQETRTERAETFLLGSFIRLCRGRTVSGQLGWSFGLPGARDLARSVSQRRKPRSRTMTPPACFDVDCCDPRSGCAGPQSRLMVVLPPCHAAARHAFAAQTGPPRSQAEQTMCSPTKDVVARLRPLLQPRGRQQRQRTGLPVVRLEDGQLPSDEQQSLDRWRSHFASNEGAVRCSPETLLQDFHRHLLRSGGDPFHLHCGTNFDKFLLFPSMALFPWPGVTMTCAVRS